MKHTAKKLIHALCGMAAMLVLVASIASVPALAASNGIYLATATPHYKHPVTGVIEDSGGDGSAVLGQSMTESATYKQALVEVDPQGNTYVTIRLQLMDNIKDPQFQVDGKAVSATLMQENYGSLSVENTADYRMKVNSENSVIRCNMFVIAMGREVIFYITVSNLQPGSGDFITSVKVEDPKPPVVDPPVSDDPPVSTDPPVTPGTSDTPTTDPVTPGTSDTPSTDPVTPDTSDVPSEPSPDTTSDGSSDTTSDKVPDSDSDSSDVPGIQEFDKAGNKVSTENESGESEKPGNPMIWWIVGGVVVLAAAGGCVWYFVSYRKKKYGRTRTMKLKKILSALLCGVMLFSLSACVNQHPEQNDTDAVSDGEPRLIATSPAVAQICNRLNLELVGVCDTSSTLPERYESLTKVGMPMNPDLEIIKSLNPDYVLSPATLQNDLQPKYAGAGVASLFLNLKSVEGMYASIEQLGEKFGRQSEAAQMLREFDTFMESYQDAGAGKENPKVLVLMGLPGSYIVATESSYVGNLVKLAGGVNVYGDGDGEEFLNANTEDMQQKDPDIILRAAHALPDDVKAMFAKEFAENDIWKHFRAVQNGKVYDLDPTLFNMSANFSYADALESLQPMLYGD